MKLRRSVCRAHGYSAHPPSYNTSMTRPSKIQSHNQTIFSLVNTTFHSLSFQLPSLPSQITFSLSHSFKHLATHHNCIVYTPPPDPEPNLTNENMNGSSNFCVKISEHNKTKNLKILLC